MSTRSVQHEESNWGSRFIEGALYPFAQVAAPGLLLILMIWFVTRGFAEGVGDGVRSFAGVLLPLMALTFLVKTTQGSERDPKSGIMAIPSWASFLAMLIIAGVTLQLLSVSTTIPIVELVVSAAFSIITFMRTSRTHYVSYCLGTVLGALGYLVLFGVPSL
ncbi:hypothetical protein EAD89_06690 [Micromonospora sp. BL4]|uniref:hypothetical protein n=1 Tax=Micromonospora sp. BL4 TaxID=2478710 RepID=UPI000EF59409|nr:hypothetical protein [Micromonospora sp. BL4]RLP93315.1 hypothetical protein EAD89_06690 [Micromonospora sp. BL4]